MKKRGQYIFGVFCILFAIGTLVASCEPRVGEEVYLFQTDSAQDIHASTSLQTLNGRNDLNIQNNTSFRSMWLGEAVRNSVVIKQYTKAVIVRYHDNDIVEVRIEQINSPVYLEKKYVHKKQD